MAIDELRHNRFSVKRIAALIGRPVGGIRYIIERAQLGRVSAVELESIEAAAKRCGYDKRTMRRILYWSGVELFPPGRHARGAHRYVQRDEATQAVRRWGLTETIRSAAQRRGICPQVLGDWLRAAKIVEPADIKQKGRPIRVLTVDIERVIRDHQRPSLPAIQPSCTAIQ